MSVFHTAVTCAYAPTQLGLGAAVLESKLPRPVLALSAYRVVQVACGAQHSAAVTSSGNLFTWGRGIEGQLGHSSRHLPCDLNDIITGIQLRPKPVPAFLGTKKRSRPVAGVSCGHNFTTVVTRAGELWAFGEGSLGQLGIGRTTRAPIPAVVMTACPATGEPFVEVAAGWAHTLARTASGSVFAWGFNALGSLGLGDHRTRFAPEHVPLHLGERNKGEVATTISTPPVAIKVHACGNCSGTLTAEGILLTWGCNSAGQLGHSAGQTCPADATSQEHVLHPRRVEYLAQTEVTDFALSGVGGAALVPLRVRSVEPASGPVEVGCEVTIRGNAFWDSPDIVVKFTPTPKEGESKPMAARSAVGTYVACGTKSVGGSGEDDDRDGVRCMAPRFAVPGKVCVEVGDECFSLRRRYMRRLVACAAVVVKTYATRT